VLLVVVVRVLMLRMQNFLSPLGMLVVRTQNVQSPAARGSGTRCSGVRGSDKNAKFSKCSREWLWYERKIS